MSPETAGRLPSGEADGGRGLVLVVDDERDFAESLEDLLLSNGFEVRQAHDAAGAREAVAGEAFDAILMDIRLGTEDGIDLIAKLGGKRPGVPVILMTAYASTDSALRAMHKGAFDYLRKPFELDELTVSLDRAVGMRRARLAKEAAERQLLSALHQRDVLLREVHHRVKNNLHVVCSLLELQAYHTRDDKAQALFRDSRNRIITMALIHQNLYESEDLARVDFRHYIPELARNLFAAYNIRPELVALESRIDEVALNIDTAIPCGLILNELLSNALKHAFPGGRKGRITVEFGSAGPRRYRLRVADDGVGLPPGVRLDRALTMGMNLISILSSQLGGELVVGGGPGTSYSLEFSEYTEAGSVLY